MNTNSNISIFNNDKFGELRVVMQGGEPWFVALDVCGALEYRDTNDTTKYLEDDEVTTYPDYSSGQLRHIKVISEAGLYSLILRSRKPEAKVFKRWVTHEVLPSIRKQGAYVHANEGDTEVEILARGMLAAKSAMERMEQQLAETLPRAEFHDKFLDKGCNIDINALSKTLQGVGINIGPNKLFGLLRLKKVLCSKEGVHKNRPFQEYVKKGWLTTKPIPECMKDEWNVTPLVTPLGVKMLSKCIPIWMDEINQAV